MYDPEFGIDNDILDMISEIAVLAGRIPSRDMPRDLKLRRTNRIRSIQSSLAIEGNTLSIEEVTDIADGKRVTGNAREVQEVRGAIEAYDLIDIIDPYSTDDLLRAHGSMTAGLVEDPGKYRQCGVGVYKGGVPVHIAPEYEDVPDLMDDLMAWAKSSDVHPLIKGCIFHCRFEYIHPFIDGNGRIGRLWHSLILSKWKEVFAFLPIESWVRLNQREYYESLVEADKGNLDAFIKFMLRIVREALDELVDEFTYSSKRMDRETMVIDIISKNPGITSAEMAKMLGVSDRTVKRYLSSLTRKGSIRRAGSDKKGYWEIL